MEPSIPNGIRLGRFRIEDRMFVGIVDGDEVIETDQTSMEDVLSHGFTEKAIRHPSLRVTVLAPFPRPSKIICIGLNYRSHIEEMNWEVPKVPIIFTKPSSAIIGPGDDIRIPQMSSRVDYEGESAIIIGKRARHTDDGGSHIFGFTCMNDVTARDLQKIDPDWTRAKGFDTFAPMGPFVSGEAPTRILTRLNGSVVQDAPLSDRVFDDAALVEYISNVMTLEPGDIIATGTPSGIAAMRPGDLVEVDLEGIGCLKNRVVS